MADEQFPQNRAVWNDTDVEAGEFSSADAGELTIPKKVSANFAAGLKFGVFASLDGDAAKTPESGDGLIIGVSAIVQNSDDFDNLNSKINTIASIARRGFIAVKIDVDNPPVVGGAINILLTAAKEGFLTSLGANVLVIASTEGMRIERVGSTTAEVYLPGKATYAVTEP